MDIIYVRPLNMAAIFKMAGEPTEFFDSRQWHHMKRSGAAKSLSNNTINVAFDSQKEKL